MPLKMMINNIRKQGSNIIIETPDMTFGFDIEDFTIEKLKESLRNYIKTQEKEATNETKYQEIKAEYEGKEITI